jgi:hypothetical protein
MNNNTNNINTLTFDNHDTYIWYIDEFTKSIQEVKLTPTDPNNTDLVTYSSIEATLYTNNENNGIIKFNSFNNLTNNFGSAIGTIITNNGILMFNYASKRDSLNLANVQQIKSLATYKSDKYANYINVEIQINFEDTYRILTISY